MKEEKNSNFSGELKPKNSEKVSTKIVKKVSVTFRENRKFDLHIGRKMVTFMGKETKKIPVDWLKHKDWLNVSKYFIVKGV